MRPWGKDPAVDRSGLVSVELAGVDPEPVVRALLGTAPGSRPLHSEAEALALFGACLQYRGGHRPSRGCPGRRVGCIGAWGGCPPSARTVPQGKKPQRKPVSGGAGLLEAFRFPGTAATFAAQASPASGSRGFRWGFLNPLASRCAAARCRCPAGPARCGRGQSRDPHRAANQHAPAQEADEKPDNRYPITGLHLPSPLNQHFRPHTGVCACTGVAGRLAGTGPRLTVSTPQRPPISASLPVSPAFAARSRQFGQKT